LIDLHDQGITDAMLSQLRLSIEVFDWSVTFYLIAVFAFFLQKLRLTGSVVEAEFNLKIIKLPSFWNVCDSDLDFAV